MKRGRRKYENWHYRPWGGWIDCGWGKKRVRELTKYEREALSMALFRSFKTIPPDRPSTG